MATKSYETLIDDLDGTEGASTVPFSINGDQYVIDLSDENQDRLILALRPFIDKARSGKPAKAGKARKSARTDPEQLAAIRAWGRANGHTVNDRGRLPASLVDAYNQQGAAQ